VRDYLREGKAGRLVCAEACIHYVSGGKDPKPLRSLALELWCGQDPLIPYNPQFGHKNWRPEQPAGCGHLDYHPQRNKPMPKAQLIICFAIHPLSVHPLISNRQLAAFLALFI